MKTKTATKRLKRSAADTSLPTSPEKPKRKTDRRPKREVGDMLDHRRNLEKTVAIAVARDLAKLNAAEFLDQTIPFLREAILRQITMNRTAPGDADEAILRARDGSTFSD